MKDFLKRLQHDLTSLQKTLEKESEELLTKVKAFANKENLLEKRAELEKIVEQRIKQYEPAISKFATSVKSNAKKYGTNLAELERKVRDNVGKAALDAKSRLEKATKRAPTKAGKKAKTTKSSVTKSASRKTVRVARASAGAKSAR